MIAKKILTAGLLFTLPMLANADTLGFRVSVGSWHQKYDGTVQNGPSVININQTLGLDNETNNVYSFTFEHPIPVLPNIRLTRTKLDTSATNTINSPFIFDGKTYNINETVQTNADLSHTDATLYYEVLDNWVSLDVGLNVRKFDKGIKIQGSTGTAQLDVHQTLPMLYVGAKVELPLTGLYVSADASGIKYKSSKLTDYTVDLGYETPIGFGIEAGYRKFDVNYEDSNNSSKKADITIDGAYAALFYHF